MDFRVGLVFGAFLLLADRPFSRGPAGWGQERSDDWTDAEVHLQTHRICNCPGGKGLINYSKHI